MLAGIRERDKARVARALRDIPERELVPSRAHQSQAGAIGGWTTDDGHDVATRLLAEHERLAAKLYDAISDEEQLLLDTVLMRLKSAIESKAST